MTAASCGRSGSRTRPRPSRCASRGWPGCGRPPGPAPWRPWPGSCSAQTPPEAAREVVEPCADRGPRTGKDSVQLGDQPLDARADLVADGADGLDALPGGVVELPVLVALAGEDRA